MIRYSLSCARGHGFDGWFRSSADYDAQSDGGLLSCPACGAREVAKALMAPAVATSDQHSAANSVLLGDKEAHLRDLIRKVREEVTSNAENVGPRFAEVARRMHDGDIEKASVYGIASPEDARALHEDGIEFSPLPALPDHGN